MSSISILIISDTHNEWPYLPEDPAPKVDVFIHCGDLTQCGGLPSFERAIESINTIDAELKLIIAGNHDVDLDPAWLEEFAEDEDDVKTGAVCLLFLKSQKAHSTYYLEEGTHTFTLRDGRSFKVFATPYTPRSGDYAFLYGEDEDRFNEGTNIMPEGVEIVVSHGPPAFPIFADYKLDVSERGEHCGCEKLAKALERTRPRLVCFGHIHEGCGAATVKWAPKELNCITNHKDTISVTRSREVVKTVLVNAALFGDGKGWLVDLEL